MEVIGAFLVAAAASFYGSVVLGILNTAVIETALNENRRNAILVAIGGVIPEIPYTLIPLFFAHKLASIEAQTTIIGIIVGCILLAYGGYIIYSSYQEKEAKKTIYKEDSKNPLVKGMLLGFLNPQLIFFWSAVIVLIESGTFNVFGREIVSLTSLHSKIAFALGASSGALLILVIYARVASKYRDKLLNLIGSKLNMIVGLFFIIFGLIVIIKNVI